MVQHNWFYLKCCTDSFENVPFQVKWYQGIFCLAHFALKASPSRPSFDGSAHPNPRRHPPFLHLFLLLLLLRVRELDHDGAGAALHGLRVVHGLDGGDGALPGRERHEGATWKQSGNQQGSSVSAGVYV